MLYGIGFLFGWVLKKRLDICIVILKTIFLPLKKTNTY